MEKEKMEKHEKLIDALEHPLNDGILLSQVGTKAVIYNEATAKYLVLKPSKEKNAKQTLEFPGGRVNADETDLEDSLKRELEEEIGSVEIKKHGLIHATTNPTFEVMNYTIAYYLFEYVSGDIELSDEHESYEWIGADELTKDIPERISSVIMEVDQKKEMYGAHEKMLRTLAEFDNYKKRSGEERKEFAKYASEKVIMDMLPVLDNFHAATGFVPEEQKDSPWLTGIMFIQQQMEKVFEDAGVKVMEIAVGDTFDAEKMEAISSQKSVDSDQSDGEDGGEEKRGDENQKVSKIVQKGYMIGDRVMRVARVEVS